MLRRELKLIWAKRTQLIQYPLILLLLLLIFPIALGDDSNILTKFAGSALWLSIIFCVLLSIDKIFHDDFADGIIDVYLINNNLLFKYIFTKIFSHWLMIILPQLIILPLFFILFNLKFDIFFVVFFSVMISSANLVLIGAFINSILLSLRSQGYLLILLLVPFYLPTLIFSVGVFSGLWVSNFSLLAAILSLLLVICPFMVKMGLKISAT